MYKPNYLSTTIKYLGNRPEEGGVDLVIIRDEACELNKNNLDSVTRMMLLVGLFPRYNDNVSEYLNLNGNRATPEIGINLSGLLRKRLVLHNLGRYNTKIADYESFGAADTNGYQIYLPALNAYYERNINVMEGDPMTFTHRLMHGIAFLETSSSEVFNFHVHVNETNLLGVFREVGYTSNSFRDSRGELVPIVSLRPVNNPAYLLHQYILSLNSYAIR